MNDTIVIWFRNLIYPKPDTNSKIKIQLKVISLLILLILTFLTIRWYIKILSITHIDEQIEHTSINVAIDKKAKINIDTISILSLQEFATIDDYTYPIFKSGPFKEIGQITDPGVYIRSKFTTKYGALDSSSVFIAPMVPLLDVINAYDVIWGENHPYKLNELNIEANKRYTADFLNNISYISTIRLQSTIPLSIIPPKTITSIIPRECIENHFFQYYINIASSKDGWHCDMQNATLLSPHPSETRYKLFESIKLGWKDYTRSPYTTLYDVSRAKYSLKIPKNICVDSLDVFFTCICEFLPIIPEPDEIGANFIRYSDAEKIRLIQEAGLNATIKFPLMENFQNMKIFFLTSLLAFLCTLCYNLICSIFNKYVKRYAKLVKLLTILLLLSIGGIIFYYWYFYFSY